MCDVWPFVPVLTDPLQGRRAEVWHWWTIICHHPGKPQCRTSQERFVCNWASVTVLQCNLIARLILNLCVSVFDAYMKLSGYEMEETIKRETSGSLKDLLLAVGKKLHNSPLQTGSVVRFSRVGDFHWLIMTHFQSLPVFCFSFKVKCARSVPAYFAETLYYSMKVRRQRYLKAGSQPSIFNAMFNLCKVSCSNTLKCQQNAKSIAAKKKCSNLQHHWGF